MKGFAPALAYNDDYDLGALDWGRRWAASFKFDGYRAVTLENGGWTRNLKRFPNLDVHDFLARLPPYLDGELVVGSPQDKGCFGRTSSLVTTKGRAGLDGVRFFAFDCFAEPGLPFDERYAMLRQSGARRILGVEEVPQIAVHGSAEADEFAKNCIRSGYEGAILRRMDAPYKFGRYTLAEGGMLKLKLTLAGEAVINKVLQRMRNDNPRRRDALGRTTRSKNKENMAPVPEVGKFLVRDVRTKKVFKCGPGVLTQAQRKALWIIRAQLPGKVLSYAYDPSTDELPRFPRCRGFRSRIDF